MLDVADALMAVLDRSSPLPPRRVPLDDALGLRLAEDVRADLDLPPFDKSIVDGYALRTADLDEGRGLLTLGEVISAGRTPTRPIQPGEAAAIMTGAPLPDRADAVVMIERTRRAGDRVEIDDRGLVPGRNILRRAREMSAGEVVARIGDSLRPARLGLLASVGCTHPLVRARPSLAVVATGDELVEPGQVPGPGQIRNSNATMLAALARSRGISAHTSPIAPDEPEALRAILRAGLERDVLIVTGGVSAGARDLVPAALDTLGVVKVFHKVRIKPGKPLWFGIGPRRGDEPGTLVFGLPGNPVSGLVGFLIFVAPALEVLGGGSARPTRSIRAQLAAPFRHTGDRPTYHPARRVVAGQPGLVEPLEWAGSADLRTVADADGLIAFPAGDRDYPTGEPLEFVPIQDVEP